MTSLVSAIRDSDFDYSTHNSIPQHASDFQDGNLAEDPYFFAPPPVIYSDDDFGYHAHGPQFDTHTTIIASVILGLAFIAMVVGVVVWITRRSATMRVSDQKERDIEFFKEHMLPMGRVDTFRGGIHLQGSDGDGTDKVIGKPPPPKYEAALPLSHQRIEEGAVVRRGEEQSNTPNADGMIVDGKMPLSERDLEDARTGHDVWNAR